ncbi:hypothetical protein VNO78_17892 [Psophocarpus tetragonolobus]|uniref:Uncharacterized protein n=1 Tax=Psophocarpus tetragonolobus TaxID=3891 RepID=A0AAN9XLH9_PSOTE
MSILNKEEVGRYKHLSTPLVADNFQDNNCLENELGVGHMIVESEVVNEGGYGSFKIVGIEGHAKVNSTPLSLEEFRLAFDPILPCAQASKETHQSISAQVSHGYSSGREVLHVNMVERLLDVIVAGLTNGCFRKQHGRVGKEVIGNITVSQRKVSEGQFLWVIGKSIEASCMVLEEVIVQRLAEMELRDRRRATDNQLEIGCGISG